MVIKLSEVVSGRSTLFCSELIDASTSPVGDAPAVRMRSIILYPADRRRTAERLSAQFGFAIAQRPGARQVTILLGRDAARDSALRARS